jgi:oxygen-independent coproporphyrinogen-3 oxidase
VQRPQNRGLYLHVPFCLQKCPYCSFYSLADRLDLSRQYVDAVKKQILRFAALNKTQVHPLTTIFFGGGTPTMLPTNVLHELLSACLHHFPCTENMEISIEVNPATIDTHGLQTLRQAGFNRLSIGVQSFNDRELQRLGRPHSAADAVQIVQRAQQADFTNINLDLMYGLPDQTTRRWQDTLDQALNLNIDHLSLYELTIEDKTPFAVQLEKNELRLPEEETLLSMMETTRKQISSAGFIRYEISNYCDPGYECRHNITYWQNGDYIGLGPGAVSCLDGTRRAAITNVEKFCARLENNQSEWQEEETLNNEARFRETVIMGLRMTQGISIQAITSRFAINPFSYYGSTLDQLIHAQLLVIDRGRLRLTDQGLMLANTVMAELV